MKVHLHQIPADGLHLEGEEECPLTEMNAEEARCAGPLRYVLDVGVSEGALWVNGSLTQPVELRCVRCLERFPYEIEVSDFAIHTELGGPEQVDLTPFAREDLLLNLPAYPHCDREGDRVCPVPALEANEAKADGEKRPTDWSALDEIEL